MRSMRPTSQLAEWLETDGLGGFASGTISGIRTRRYHALLLAATEPPTGRMVLVNGIEAWVEMGGERLALTSQRYTPDVVYPDARERIESFEPEPWPRWVLRLHGDARPTPGSDPWPTPGSDPPRRLLQHEVFAVRGSPIV